MTPESNTPSELVSTGGLIPPSPPYAKMTSGLKELMKADRESDPVSGEAESLTPENAEEGVGSSTSSAASPSDKEAAVRIFDCVKCGDGSALRDGEECAYCGL